MKELNKSRIEIILNKSLTYFLPMVDAQVDFRFLHLLKNCYLYDVDDGNFCVLYEWSSHPEFVKWEKELMNHHLFLGHEDYDKMVLYKFRLSPNMREAKELFLNGKYSMFTDEHKNDIDNFLKKKNASNRVKIRNILSRDEALRKEMEKSLGTKIDPNDELSSKPNLHNENFSNFREEIKFNIEQFLNEGDK